ncbi:hypothetical protein [Streptomyces sp. NPDC020298]|uniref:hypothetical protein n=1 Tax=unclassified Streptomyces TaxID=2593676 RepID=UPI0033E5A5E0
MNIAFDALAMAALGGMSGQLGQSAVAALWDRLRARFAHDPDITATLEVRDSADAGAISRLSGALRQLAEDDVEFRAELEDFTRQYGSLAPVVNTVRDSQGLNAPGGTFTAPITMNFGEGTESSTQ